MGRKVSHLTIYYPLVVCFYLLLSQSLEQFFLTVGQNNFGNKIPFPKLTRFVEKYFYWNLHNQLLLEKNLNAYLYNIAPFPSGCHSRSFAAIAAAATEGHTGCRSPIFVRIILVWGFVAKSHETMRCESVFSIVSRQLCQACQPKKGSFFSRKKEKRKKNITSKLTSGMAGFWVDSVVQWCARAIFVLSHLKLYPKLSWDHLVSFMYTNSLVNATFGSGKKSC